MYLDTLINAQLMQDLHPTTFRAPTEDELKQIRVGDSVKIGTVHGTERFWTTVIDIDGSVVTAKVDNDLIFTHIHGYKDANVIQFFTHNIYSVWDEGVRLELANYTH